MRQFYKQNIPLIPAPKHGIYSEGAHSPAQAAGMVPAAFSFNSQHRRKYDVAGTTV